MVRAAAPEWIINDLPNVGIHPDKYYRPVPLPDINYLPCTGALMTVDPAGTGTDETTYTITKTLHGLVFLLDAGGFPPGQGHAPATLEGLAKLAERYRVNKIIIEANFGDGMFAKLLQPHLTARYPVGVEEIKHNVQKERRICDTCRLAVVAAFSPSVFYGIADEAEGRGLRAPVRPSVARQWSPLLTERVLRNRRGAEGSEAGRLGAPVARQ